MNRRQAVLVGVLLSVIAAALIGFGSVAVVDSLSGAARTSGVQTPAAHTPAAHGPVVHGKP